MIAVIIPCYNEESDIQNVLSAFVSVLKGEYRIYVYDNNSTDNTCEKVKEFINKNSNIELRHEPRRGKGNVIKTAFKEIDADYYVMCDGDNTYDVSGINSILKYFQDENADMFIGDRLSTNYFSENKRIAGNIGNVFIRWLINTVYHVNYPDALSGFRVFSRKFVKEIEIKSSGFDIETEINIYAAKNKCKVIAGPVAYQDRKESKSKLKTIPDGVRILFRAVRMMI